MKQIHLLLLVILTAFFADCSSQSKMQQEVLKDKYPVAFPGAEGFGKYTSGGRGG